MTSTAVSSNDAASIVAAPFAAIGAWWSSASSSLRLGSRWSGLQIRAFKKHAWQGFLVGFLLSITSVAAAGAIGNKLWYRRENQRRLRRAGQKARGEPVADDGEEGENDELDGPVTSGGPVQIRIDKSARAWIGGDDDDDDRDACANCARSAASTSQGLIGLIGNTPLVRINSLSDALGVEILGKAEFLNPGGSVKDRVALRIIQDAERRGILKPKRGDCIFEGTVGSTGISIATIGRAMGYRTHVVVPDDVAGEKVHTLRALGATVEQVRPASFVDERQFVNLAKKRAEEYGKDQSVAEDAAPSGSSSASSSPSSSVSSSSTAVDTTMKPIAPPTQTSKLESSPPDVDAQPRGYFADQFENPSNFDAHYEGTGPEIWRQTSGDIDAFVSGAGTGGTLAGTAAYLREQQQKLKVARGGVERPLRIILSDPQGSGLFNKVKYGVMFDLKEREGTKRRHQVDTIVEGIGINRVTANFERGRGLVNDAYR